MSASLATAGVVDATFMAELVRALPEAVVVVDSKARVEWANTTAEDLLGRTSLDVVGSSGLDLVHPDDVGLAVASLATVQAKAIGSAIELRIAASTGWTLVELIGVPLGAGRLLLSMRDLTLRRRWEVARDDTARFRAIVHHAAGLTMLLTVDGAIESVSGAMLRELGHDPEAVCGAALTQFVDAADHDMVDRALTAIRAATTSTPIRIEVGFVRHDGVVVPYELSFVSLHDDPTMRGVVVSGHDITDLRTAQEALELLAAHDGLTGLQNRRTFDAALEREWTLTSRDGIDSYVVVLDLDGFKLLNDTCGHAAGDDALRQVAGILRSIVRETDVVARIGGDEFAVILVRCGGEPAAIGLEQRVTERVRHLHLDDARLTASVGHQSLRQATSPEDALHRADLAMLATKAKRLR